jgi:hypothetical protein
MMPSSRGGYDEIGARSDTEEDERARAARRVASAATDATDAAMLLEALGLTAEEGRPDSAVRESSRNLDGARQR